MSPLFALTHLLEDSGVGVRGETIFAGLAAELPDPAQTGGAFLTVASTGGFPPIGTHNEGFTALRRPSFQITARANTRSEAETLANAAYRQCDRSNVQVDDVFFLMMYPINEPFDMPPDIDSRVRVAFNIATVLR